MVTREAIGRLLRLTCIVEVAAERGIELRPLGPELLVGRCPRHRGVGRSLLVERGSGRFRCLVCSLHGGNAIGLVMQTDALPFLPAVLKLAARVGLDLETLGEAEPSRPVMLSGEPMKPPLPQTSEVPVWALTPPVFPLGDDAHVPGEVSPY